MNVYGNALMDAKTSGKCQGCHHGFAIGSKPVFSNVEKSLQRLVAGAGFEPATFGL
jgi:hypothetical protein